jgi:hypothetical protein
LGKFAFGTLQQAFDARLPDHKLVQPLEFGAERLGAIVSVDVDR